MHPYRTVSRIALTAFVVAVAVRGGEAATYRNVANVQPGHVAWIYRQPDTASPHVDYLKAGALRVHTMSCKRLAAGGWCHVMRRGTSGWVQDRFLKVDNEMRG